MALSLFELSTLSVLYEELHMNTNEGKVRIYILLTFLLKSCLKESVILNSLNHNLFRKLRWLNSMKQKN